MAPITHRRSNSEVVSVRVGGKGVSRDNEQSSKIEAKTAQRDWSAVLVVKPDTGGDFQVANVGRLPLQHRRVGQWSQ